MAQATGISAHTLRIWERRYGAFALSRTDGGVRLYSDADVSRLHRLKALLDQGHAIGQIAHLPDTELEQLLAEGGLSGRLTAPLATSGLPAALSGDFVRVRESFLESVRTFDLAGADRTLQTAIVGTDPRALVMELLPPLFEEIGQRWETGAFEVAHEHAATALLRNALGGLQTNRRRPPHARSVVATTLSGELHEFGALLAALLATVHGWNATYLGPSLPIGDIHLASTRVQASAVLISAVCAERPSRRKHFTEQLGLLRDALPTTCELLLGGALAPQLRPVPRGVRVLQTLPELERWLTTRR